MTGASPPARGAFCAAAGSDPVSSTATAAKHVLVLDNALVFLVTGSLRQWVRTPDRAPPILLCIIQPNSLNIELFHSG